MSTFMFAKQSVFLQSVFGFWGEKSFIIYFLLFVSKIPIDFL